MTKISTAYKSRKHACDVVRSLIKRTPGVALHIPIDVVQIHVRMRKPLRVLKVWWPMIKMGEWANYLISQKPQLLLGGHGLDGDWRTTLKKFWSSYRQINSSHPVFSQEYDLGLCVPYFVHGDEGRGQLRRPYMVISWQCVIGHHGLDVVNDTSYLRNIFLFYGRNIGITIGTSTDICSIKFDHPIQGIPCAQDSFFLAFRAIYTIWVGP